MSGMDKISNLPDSVLCHILSFLPTEDAVLTGVLSKRWKGLWLSVPTLEFEQDVEADYMHRVQFIIMVYTVILQRDVEPVEKFSLRLSHPSWCSYGMVNTWVKAVLKRGAQHLDLSMPHQIDLPYHLIDLPSATFGSRTLVVLKLGYVSVNTIVTNGFPSLKVLHLTEVVFDNEECLTRLIFGSPILEEFFLDYWTIAITSGDSGAIITEEELRSLNSLVSAVILFCIPYIPLKWICKVKSLCIYDVFIPHYDFNFPFPNLTSLELLIDHYYWSWLIDEVLQNCPNLQHFEINHMENSYNHPIHCKKWQQPKFVPECLSIHLRTCTLRDYQGRKCEQLFSKYIMQNSKVLRIMRLCSKIFSDPELKHKVIRQFSTFPNGSAECKLHLNVK